MPEKYKGIKVIGFDADDTLWINELYYREKEQQFAELLNCYLPEEKLTDLPVLLLE